MVNNNELYHWGIKGMKWGVRRYQNKDGSLTPAGKKRAASFDKKAKQQGWSDDAVYAKKVKTKKLNQMSNEELRKFNERTRLENEYKNLTKKNIKGKKFVSEVLNNTAKNVVTEYATRYATSKGQKFGIDISAKTAKNTAVNYATKRATKFIDDLLDGSKK